MANNLNKFTPEELMANMEVFYNLIKTYIQEPRRSKLLEFYKKHEDELVLMPASHKTAFHSAFPGGYISHVNRVVQASLRINSVWKEFGVDTSTYSIEELVFSAINHDLGKMGDGTNYNYTLSTDNWRIKNMGEIYEHNEAIGFMKVPDRSLFLLANAGIEVSENEWVAIQTHDGLYDEGNVAYLKAYSNACRPRTSIPFILHQGDMLAARVEWESDNLEQFKTQSTKITKPTPKKENKPKVNNDLLDMLNQL